MKKFKYLVLIIFIYFFFISNVKADNVINIHLFYGDGCPHCAAEEEFLNEYLKNQSDVNLIKYEVWNNKDNQALYGDVQKALKETVNSIPYLIIGEKSIVGYSPEITDKEIKKYVEYYKNNDEYQDVVTKVINNEEVIITKKTNQNENNITEVSEEIEVPVLGRINAKKVSLPLLAVVLGFIDGFNPCAMWVLLFLITMLINMKNRKKMWALGITFILTSGVVYLAFMMTWLSLATFISGLFFFRLLISLVAFTVGFVNLYNFYKSTKKDDGCSVVEKKDRKKIMNQIIKITTEKKFVFAMLGIMVLAASVNIIEVMCSLGLPLLFTQVLAMNNLSFGSYMLYMFIYIFFFLIDDIIVFVISMITLKVTGISTKYSKYSHLIAGIITLLIGLLLLIKPSILMLNF